MPKAQHTLNMVVTVEGPTKTSAFTEMISVKVLKKKKNMKNALKRKKP